MQRLGAWLIGFWTARLERHPVRTCVVLALVLTAHTVFNGLVFDDHMFRARGLQGRFGAMLGSTDNYFLNTSDTDEHRAEARAAGLFPWWSSREARNAKWAPLASALHRFDYAWFPFQPWVMHLHSLLWWLALVSAAAFLYRTVDGGAPVVAALAAGLFTLDDAHGFSLGWVANRHELVASVFGCLALAASLRPGLLWRVAGPVLWALALLSGEYALCFGGYLAASLLLDGSRWRRVGTLLPFAVLTGVWGLLYLQRGNTMVDLDAYVSPLSLRFLPRLALNGPILQGAQWGLLWSDPTPLLPTAVQAGLAALGVALVAAVAWVATPVLRQSATARFWAVGSLLATIPVCSGMPNDRYLYVIGLGAAGLLAELLVSAPAALAHRRLVGVLAVVHLGLAPVLLPVRAALPGLLGRGQEAQARQLDTLVDVRGKTLVVVRAPASPLCFLLPLFLESFQEPPPERVACLGLTSGALSLRTVGERTLEVEVPRGYFSTTVERLSWSVRHPLTVGSHLQDGALTIDVLEVTDDGRPVRLRFTLDLPLKDAVLVQWTGKRFERVEPPAPGERLTFPPAVTLGGLR